MSDTGLKKVCIQPPMTDFEKFSNNQLNELRDDLLRSGLDYFQAAELLTAFLSQHGYGVSNNEARGAASRIEAVGCNLPFLQEELERLAFVM